MFILSHPTGNFNVRTTAKALYELGQLQEFNTCISLPRNNPILDLLPVRLKEEYLRRVFSEIPESFQNSHPYRESIRMILSKIISIGEISNESHPVSIDSIYRSFDKYVSRRINNKTLANSVYSYEDGAHKTFMQAKKFDMKCVYELPIGYWKVAREIYQEEKDLKPEWASTLPGLKDSKSKLARKDEELMLSDLIVVASKYVESTLPSDIIASKKIAVIPYCTPQNKILEKPCFNKGKLRVLYVGSLTQRKGLSYAIDAINMLNGRVSFTIIGQKTSDECKPLNQSLEKYQWIPSLPYNLILEHMRNNDVLLFPTLFDGFGLVITEAMSQGLPIITTMNSGGPECIRHGREGFLVPLRNPEAIVSCIEDLDENRDKLEYMKISCLERAKYLTYDVYKNQLMNALGIF